MSKGLDEKADELNDDDHPECVRARDSHGAYRLIETAVHDADEVTDEGKFPKYGDWIPVERLSMTGSVQDEAWLECPAGLADALLDAGIDTETPFVIQNVAKGADGAFVFDLSGETDL